jgi:hypothetical protein
VNELNENSHDKHDEAQMGDHEQIVNGSAREQLCDRVEQRLASLRKRCNSSRQERRWLPGL